LHAIDLTLRPDLEDPGPESGTINQIKEVTTMATKKAKKPAKKKVAKKK
jgi:hypothetical protein